MMRYRPWTALSGLALLLSLLGCSSELEVKGNAQRVIGERVTLALVEGDSVFDGEVSLSDARGGVHLGSALAVQKTDDRKLSFVIPPATAAGSATVRVKQKGGGEYAVPLTISRLAVTIDQSGHLGTLALPPSSLGAAKPAEDFTGFQLSMAPGGGTVVALGKKGSQKAAYFFRLGKETREYTSVALAGSSVAALPSGVIVGTPTSIQVYLYTEGKGIDTGPSLTVKNTQAIAVGSDGKRAVALVQCDPDTNGAPQKDCFFSLDLSGSTLIKGPEVQLDANPGAKLLAVRANGLAAVVADGDKVYGIDFTAAPPKLTTLSWTGAKAVALARSTTVIQNKDNDLFAIADEMTKTIRMVGFQGTALAEIDSVITLEVVPSHLAFGRATDLYVVAGPQLLQVDASVKDATPVPLAAQLAQTPLSFVVQP